MRPYLLIFLVSLGITLVSCTDKNTNQEFLFEAEVLGLNSDCGLFAIQFTKNIQQANEICGTLYTEYIFIAKNLPNELQVEGISIVLNIRRIQQTEIGACTTLGVGYPWLYVLEAKRKE